MSNTPKTKEERQAAKLRKRQEREEQIRRFPGARLSRSENNSGVSVELRAGENIWLEVHHRGKWLPGRFDTWTEMSILLTDPVVLASFIRALVARYNAMVSEMNTEASECGMTPANVMSDSGSAPTPPAPKAAPDGTSHTE